MMARKRNLTIFEKLILAVGLIVVIGGLFFLNQLLAVSGGVMTASVMIGAALWLILIFVLILAAIAENSREELGTIITENSLETKLLRDLSKEHLAEVRLMRQAMEQWAKKK